MCGVFPHTGIMKNKLNHRFGYINCKDRDGYEVRGHEFHYSEIQEATEKNNKYFDVAGSRGEWQCGYISDNTIAGYPHIHFFSNVEYFKNLFQKAYI